MGLIEKLFGKKDTAASNAREADVEVTQAEESPAASAATTPVEPLALPEAAPVAVPPIGTALPSPVETPLAAPALVEEDEDAPPASGSGPFLLKDKPAVVKDVAGEEAAAAEPGPMTVEQMRNDPNFVRVYDQYGQEVF